MDIGWIGLGTIGTRMVKRLLQGGHAVTVYPRGAGLAECAMLGAGQAGGYAELARTADLLAIALYDDDQVRDVLLENGALAAMRPGAILGVHTTGSPVLMRELAEKAPAGVQVLDAAFSGGPADVDAGRLTLMVGGEASALEKARPAFEAYCTRIERVGPLGHGQTLKLLNNLMLATNLMNAHKLLELAEGYGFETTEVARILQECSGASYAMRLFRNAPLKDVVAASRQFIEKDVAVASVAAAEAGLDIGAFDATAAYFAKD